MHKFLLLLTISIGSFTPLLGQTPVLQTPAGSFLGPEGQLIHAHADLDLAPDAPLVFPFVAKNVPLPKYNDAYYTADGSRHSGEISYSYGKSWISMEEMENPKKEKISYEVGWSVQMGLDSFVVAKGFKSWAKLGYVEEYVSAPHMLRHVADTEAFSFFQTTYGASENTYVLYVKQTKKFVGLPVTFKAFMEESTPHFQAYPEMLALLQQKELPHDDVPQLIRFIQYTDALHQQKPLSFTADLTITTIPSKIAYTAQVQRQEALWRLDFSTLSGEKLFTEHYLYAEPTKKQGDFVWYYPATGTKRREYSVTQNEAPKTQQYYHPNGALQYFTLLSSDGKTRYLKVFSPEGKPLLDEYGTGTEEVYDEVLGRTLVREYVGELLVSSYYLDAQGRKVYQLASRNASIKSPKIVNTSLLQYALYPQDEAAKGIEGLVLVRVLLDAYGQVEQSSVLRGLTPAIDQAALNLFNDAKVKLRFSAGRHKKEHVAQELIVPVYFQCFFEPRKSNYYFHYYHNPLPVHIPVAPPSMPRF